MKRFHVHLHVSDLQASIAFYTRLFSAQPTRIEGDYAKWMLDDPRLNFAISTRGTATGLDHLGLQVDSADELADLKASATAAEMALIDEGQTSCCYARSDKHWITDPDGNAWEHFHTLDAIPVFSEKPAAMTGLPTAAASACCAPTQAVPIVSPVAFAMRKPIAGLTVTGGAPAGGTSACCGPTSTNTCNE